MPSARSLLLAILIGVLSSTHGFAAEPPLGLIADDISTGVLMGPGPELSGLHLHDGSATAPRVTTGLWRQMLFELSQASVTDRTWPIPRTLERAARASVPAHVVPVSILDLDYQRLPKHVQPHEPVSPEELERGRLFAAAPLRGTTYHGGRLVFAFDDEWMIGRRHQDIEMDAGDGRGWRSIHNNRLEARAPSTGEMIVRLRVQTDDGAVLTTRFALQIAALITPAPHDTILVQATVDHHGVTGAGSAYILLATGHTALTNPVVVVEGFDLDDTMGWDELYAMLNQEQLIETLRTEGFDAVVLDFDSATAPIQRNAFVLAELLAQVQATIPALNTSVLIGASMGGLVSRYALGWMETQGFDHGIRTWISFDSPQRGADIPLGLQHWLDFFQGDSESAAYLLSRLDTPASRQMLLLHHDATNGTSAGPDALRLLFEQDLASVGLPSCRRVAVANGSGTMADQGFAPGQQLIRYEYYSFLLDLKGNVWSLPDGPTTRIFQGEKNVIWPLPDTYFDVNVGGTTAWDGAPGGWRSSMAQMDTTSVPYGDIEALHDHHCFIPTISSLDLNVLDPFHDVLGDPDLMSRTSFDALYIPTWNQEHVAITPESASWFLDEIRFDSTQAGPTPTAKTSLLLASPNPFNPSTTIRFEVRQAGPITLDVFDQRGRRVSRLENRTVEAGVHAINWTGRTDDDRALAAGTYVIRLTDPLGTTSRGVTMIE